MSLFDFFRKKDNIKNAMEDLFVPHNPVVNYVDTKINGRWVTPQNVIEQIQADLQANNIIKARIGQPPINIPDITFIDGAWYVKTENSEEGYVNPRDLHENICDGMCKKSEQVIAFYMLENLLIRNTDDFDWIRSRIVSAALAPMLRVVENESFDEHYTFMDSLMKPLYERVPCVRDEAKQAVDDFFCDNEEMKKRGYQLVEELMNPDGSFEFIGYEEE